MRSNTELLIGLVLLLMQDAYVLTYSLIVTELLASKGHEKRESLACEGGLYILLGLIPSNFLI